MKRRPIMTMDARYYISLRQPSGAYIQPRELNRPEGASRPIDYELALFPDFEDQ